MARVRRSDGTLTAQRNSLPETMNTGAKRPRVTYESARTLHDIGRLIHKEYPSVTVIQGKFIAKIVFTVIERSLFDQCGQKQKRRSFRIPGFGTFYARPIPPVQIKNTRRGVYDLPARYRLAWKPLPELKKRISSLTVLPDEKGEFGYSFKTKVKRQQVKKK